MAFVLHRSRMRLEHQVEGASLGEVVGAAVGADAFDLVGPPALVAVLAVDQGVGEGGQVPRGVPHGRGTQNGGVEPDDVVALLHHGAPPRVLDIAQHVDPEGAVVVGGAEAAVDLGRREDEATVTAQADDFLHQVVGGVLGSLGGLGGLCHRCRIPERILALTSLARSRPRTVSTARPSTRVTRPSIASGSARLSHGTPRGVRSESASPSNSR